MTHHDNEPDRPRHVCAVSRHAYVPRHHGVLNRNVLQPLRESAVRPHGYGYVHRRGVPDHAGAHLPSFHGDVHVRADGRVYEHERGPNHVRDGGREGNCR